MHRARVLEQEQQTAQIEMLGELTKWFAMVADDLDHYQQAAFKDILMKQRADRDQ